MQPFYELTMKTDISTDVMTISQMCEAYDVTPRTLRFYEAKELLDQGIRYRTEEQE